jgi:hypothetical protein
LLVHLGDAQKLQSTRKGLDALVPKRTPNSFIRSKATNERLDIIGMTEGLVVCTSTWEGYRLAKRTPPFGYILDVLNGKGQADIYLIAVQNIRNFYV